MPTFVRPSWEDAVIVVVAVVVFAAVQLSGGGEDAGDAPAATATPSPAARSSAAQPTPSPAVSPSPAADAATPAATPSPAPEARDPDACDFREELERVRGAVVQVFAGGSSRGTGFHLGGGRYVTAAHVIQDDAGRLQHPIRILSAAEDRLMTAEAGRVGEFSETPGVTLRDLAELRAEPIGGALTGRAPASGDGGRDARALGYPWSQVDDGLEGEPSAWPDPLVIKGNIAAVAESGGIAIVQVDARVQQGMSGGPLVDECGAALGVASFVPLRSDDGGGAQQGFAVFISIAELANLQ